MPSIVRSATTDSNVPLVVGNLPVADNQTIALGDLLEMSSGKVAVAAAASTTIFGIANEVITTTTATATDVISATLVKGQVVRLSVDQTGTKKTFAQADYYTTAYDLKDKTSVNPDDTTGGMCYVVGADNTAHTVDVIIADGNLAHVG